MSRIDPEDTGALDVAVIVGLVLMCGGLTWIAVSPSARLVAGCVLGGSPPGHCLKIAKDLSTKGATP